MGSPFNENLDYLRSEYARNKMIEEYQKNSMPFQREEYLVDINEKATNGDVEAQKTIMEIMNYENTKNS
jgi:hypothetical protein